MSANTYWQPVSTVRKSLNVVSSFFHRLSEAVDRDTDDLILDSHDVERLRGFRAGLDAAERKAVDQLLEAIECDSEGQQIRVWREF